MRIGVQTWGSEGDVRPLLALAAGLRSAGHDVTLAYSHLENRDLSDLGAAFGVRTRRVGSVDPEVLSAAGRRLIPVRNPITQVKIIAEELFDPLAGDMLLAARELCRENDIVIGHVLVHPLQAAAERSQVPRVSVLLAPLIPSRQFPPPGMPDLGGLLNGLLWHLSDRIFSRLFLPSLSATRRQEGLPKVKSMLYDCCISPYLNLIGVSPSLFPPPRDWGEHIRFCGAFVLPLTAAQPELPRDLASFLDAGPPPVYLTFGSMLIADPQSRESVRLLFEASRLAGCRAVIQATAELFSGTAAPPDVFRTGPVPHDLVFPRCSAVVHHGGSGTTQAAARAGCPQVVVQHATDQTFWGGLVHRAGIASPVLDRRTVTAGQLARSIRQALDDPRMKERSARTGALMRKENGVHRAVELIEQRFGRHHQRS